MLRRLPTGFIAVQFTRNAADFFHKPGRDDRSSWARDHHPSKSLQQLANTSPVLHPSFPTLLPCSIVLGNVFLAMVLAILLSILLAFLAMVLVVLPARISVAILLSMFSAMWPLASSIVLARILFAFLLAILHGILSGLLLATLHGGLLAILLPIVLSRTRPVEFVYCSISTF